jgi:hypothetical protein
MSEHNYGPSAAGSVVLNLGKDIGALIIQADAGLLGAEIEISRVDGDDGDHVDPGDPDHHHGRTHAMVRERHTLPHPRYDAVYPDLRAGRYAVWRDASTQAATVTITGGEITTYRLVAESGPGVA